MTQEVLFPIKRQLSPFADRDAQSSVAVLGSIVAGCLALGYCLLSREGPANTWSVALQTTGIGLFLLHVPVACSLVFRRRADNAPLSWYQSGALMSLLGLAALVCGGLALGPVGFPIKFLFIVAGLGLCFWNAIGWACRRSLWQSSLAVTFGAGFSLWVAGMVWGSTYHHPLILDGISREQVGADTLYHAAIANMIKTHGLPSTGLDGLPYLRYHYGSHWIFAQVSAVLGQPILEFYQLGFPVIFVPFLLHNLFYLALTIRHLMPSASARLDEHTNGWVYLVFFFGFLGFVPAALAQKAGVDTASLFLSASYNLGVSLALLLLALLFLACSGIRERGKRASVTDWLFFLLVLPLALMAIGLCKISLMLLLLGLLFWLFWRCRGYQRVFLWVSLGLAFVGAYATSLAVRDVAGSEHRFFGYLRDTVGPDWLLLHLLLLWCWPLFYACLRIASSQLHTLGDLKRRLVARDLLDLELLAVLAVLGMAPAAVIYMYSAEVYFADFQHWVGLAFVLAYLPLALAKFPSRPVWVSTWKEVSLRSVCGFLLLLFVLSALVCRWFDGLNSLMEANFRHWGANEERMAWFRNARWQKKAATVWQTWSAQRQASLLSLDLPNYRMLAALHELEKLPAKEKKQTALFIPRTNRMYWDMVHDAGSACLGPALSGLAMVDGLPMLDEAVHWYGYNFYDLTNRRTNLCPKHDSAWLLERANSFGFAKVLVVECDAQGNPHFYYLPGQTIPSVEIFGK